MSSKKKTTKRTKPTKKRTRPTKKRPGRARPVRREISEEQLLAVLARARRVMSAEDVEVLTSVVDTLAFLTHELEHKGVTIARLRKLLLGSSSEKSKDVLDDGARDQPDRGADTSSDGDPDATGAGEGDDESEPPKKKRKGHGRRGADRYTGADRQTVAHDGLCHGDRCPECERGKVYRQAPKRLVRVRGVAPLSATVYELERLRCNLCGQIFTAPAPPGVGDDKYDESSASMIALLKYGCGLPFNRLERLGEDLGIPLPSATQWEVVERAASAFEPVWAELVRQAAAGDVVYIDDTRAKVLALAEEIREQLARGETDRTGIFTSGVVSTAHGRELVLFFTSRQHAGENLAKVLAQRSDDRPPPIQMCDATSKNISPADFDTILAHCMAHGRRHFVDVVDNFPDEVAHVLEAVRVVYRVDAEARKQGMSPDERLHHHQTHSKPVMDELEAWLQAQFDERKVEPNSTLGEAITYMQNHWDELTLFLRVPGAPLDNNIVERALKRAILHRKNSLFYKTENGARVGDLFMSLISTAERAGQNPFDYLNAVQRHRDAVEAHPERWMPWSYAETLAGLEAPADEPA